MFEFKRAGLAWLAAAGFATWFAAGPFAEKLNGQPALTTIQDTLYKADGTRFTGTMFIRWNSFLSGDTSNIAQADLTLQIVNGVLNVKLVPTTTATAGAQYLVTYNSAGRIQFTETWAVPPSSLALRVRDVRISAGSIVGPPPVISPVQIADVIGLTNALSVRPSFGVGFGIGRAAVINQAGQIDAAIGNLGDCVRVDGSSGPCGGGGSGIFPSFSDSEIPSGTIDGSNAVFNLANVPSPVGSLTVFRNGLLMEQGVDYSLAAKTITFFTGAQPRAGDSLMASYRWANATNPLGSLTSPQVICSSVGTSTSSTTLTQLGSCTIPSGLLGTGDRIEIQFHYGHTGSATGFTGEIHWGGTTILSRAGTSGDTVLSGKNTIGVFSGGQTWDAQSWGNNLTQSVSAGSSSENTAASVALTFHGQLPGASADTVVLRNFTVIRYPAQTNP